MIGDTEIKISIVHHVNTIRHVSTDALILLNTVILKYLIRFNASEIELWFS